MKCTKCYFLNRSGVSFCEQCGARIGYQCPHCGNLLPSMLRFCGVCGQNLTEVFATRMPTAPISGERKLLTILFSDLVGYTALSERLDPEEVKEVMTRIFSEIALIVNYFDGYLQESMGDSVLILFGIPNAHEDDPVRAIRAARQTHKAVKTLSHELAPRIGQPLAMHSGIESGLVVISHEGLDPTSGYTVTGDAVNVASRLCSLAGAEEILVGQETYRRAEGYFLFKSPEPVHLKGRTEAVRFHKVRSVRPQSNGFQRLSSLRSKLVGREREMEVLHEAVNDLLCGKPSIIAIYGNAGSGKSRLVDEFASSLDFDRIRWLEAHAYAYTQSIPYWTLVDLLNKTWRIEEDDSPQEVRGKIEAGVEALLGKNERVCEAITSLYSLQEPGVKESSPEIWKSQLFEAVFRMLEARTRLKPTILCLEDLHWTDLSSVELLQTVMSNLADNVLIIFTQRPNFNLFSSQDANPLGDHYKEIRLQDLSAAQAQMMMESLLQTTDVPYDLRRYIEERAEGNPFYLEEMINSLIDAKVLVKSRGCWQLTKPVKECGVSSTIQGVIAARLDCLSGEMKRILQEASVIGRTFLYQILESVTTLREQLDDCLNILEKLDLIHLRIMQPDLEYMFKHVLTQEVVYNGLLLKQRKSVHERVAQVMEQLFHDRLAEFYETLAFHYKRGHSLDKALDYLVKSGKKCIKRYAGEESHQYFREAYELLLEGQGSAKNKAKLVDVLIDWAFVYYYTGRYKDLLELLKAHRETAESLGDKDRLGMYYSWLSCAMWHREMFNDAHHYLLEALRLGEETSNPKVVGYACTWLAWSCVEMGRLQEALDFAERAQEIALQHNSDHYVYFNSLAAFGNANWRLGCGQKAHEAGSRLIEFGQQNSDIRSVVMGHLCRGFSHLVGGDLAKAGLCFEKAVQVSADPWYSKFPKLALCYARIFAGEFQGVEETLRDIISFSDNRGAEYIGTPSRLFLGALLAARGDLSGGVRMLEWAERTWQANGCRVRHAESLYVLARLYARIGKREGGSLKRLFSSFKNFAFLLRNAPIARKKAVRYYSLLIKEAQQMGAENILGRAYLGLGELYQDWGKTGAAQDCLTKAAIVFERSQAECFLAKTRDLLSLSSGDGADISVGG